MIDEINKIKLTRFLALYGFFGSKYYNIFKAKSVETSHNRCIALDSVAVGASAFQS